MAQIQIVSKLLVFKVLLWPVDSRTKSYFCEPKVYLFELISVDFIILFAVGKMEKHYP